jgi:hypothetical protein
MNSDLRDVASFGSNSAITLTPTSLTISPISISQNGQINIGSGYVSNTTLSVISSASMFSIVTASSNMTLNLSSANNFTISLNLNVSLTLSNMTIGQSGIILLIQAVGSSTVTFNSIFKWSNGSSPTLSTSVGAVDAIFYTVVSANFVIANFFPNFA